jgi:nucleoside-diphosphate-sugar epimerase
MYHNKTVLLIAGGGTLGTKTAEELLRLGAWVEILCPEEKVSHHERLLFHQGMGTEETLSALFAKKHYDGIVNFIHYKEVEDYKKIHPLLMANTDHLIFLSSYRVYADLQHPITEDAPQLLDVIKDDPRFLEQETYALAKARAERFLADNPYPKNWTVVRPVISFSSLRFDLILTSNHELLDAAREKRTLTLPLQAKHLTAGFDWAGNSGKLIANLLFKEGTIGQAYTVSSAQNLTWEQVADLYTELLGLSFVWEEQDFPDDWRWPYDRAYDRAIDNTKILRATGLTPEDFTPIKEGLKTELKLANMI